MSRLLDPDGVDRQHCEVIGVAELHGRLYVLQNKSKSIRVSLAEKPYSMLSDVPLDGVIEPTDLAASTFDNCIYVTDVGDIGCILRVQVEERVVERFLEHVELKFDQDEGGSAESLSVRTEPGQGTDRGMEQMNTPEGRVECVREDEIAAASVTEDVSVTNAEGQQHHLLQNRVENETCEQSKTTPDNASKLQEPKTGDVEQRGQQAGIDLRAFLRAVAQGQVCSADATHMTQHSKCKSSLMIEVQPMKNDDAEDMTHSLLQRTGLTQKIAERENAGPCVFEISRHYKVKRFLFIVDVTVCHSGVTLCTKMIRMNYIGILKPANWLL